MKIKPSHVLELLIPTGQSGKDLSGKRHLVINGNGKKELEKQRQGGGIVPGKRKKCEGPKVEASLVCSRIRGLESDGQGGRWYKIS